MNVTEIPFNHFIGIKRAEKSPYLLQLDESTNHLNHLGTIHASAQFALAEAAGGLYLLERFAEYTQGVIPVVRRVEVKYSKPATGRLYASATVGEEAEHAIQSLTTRGRAILQVDAKVVDSNENITMAATYEWFVTRNR